MVRNFLRAAVIAAALVPLGGAGWYSAMEAYKFGDLERAIREFRTLADQGNADAQSTLALMYEKGEGVLRDDVRAHMWYDLAAAILSPGRKRDIMIRYRDELAGRMTPGEVAEARRLAAAWMAKFRAKNAKRK